LHVVADVLGLDAGTWSVLIASAALAVSAWGVLMAKRSAVTAERSAAASERSADATVAAVEAASRSAGAAEISAQHSERSSTAAERSAAADERAVAIEEDRVRHEARQRVDRDAPRWEPLAEDESAWWISDDRNLSGILKNSGKVSATVVGVEVDLPNGGLLRGKYRAEPRGPADGGFVSRLSVRPGGALRIEFDAPDGSLGPAMRSAVRPRIQIEAESDDLGWNATRLVELLRQSGGVTSAIRWKPRAVD
jgi:hypothetical protein